MSLILVGLFFRKESVLGLEKGTKSDFGWIIFWESVIF